MKVFTRDTTEYQIFFEIWNYFKKYAKVDNPSESFWTEFIKEGYDIYEKFKTPLAKGLIICCIEDISRRKEKS